MLSRSIRRRSGWDGDALAGDLHPLLRRLYAARGVRLASELDLALNQLVPIGQLDGIAAAVELLCAHFLKRSAIVVIGDFDADGATSTALVVRRCAPGASRRSISSCRTASSSATGSRPRSCALAGAAQAQR